MLVIICVSLSLHMQNKTDLVQDQAFLFLFLQDVTIKYIISLCDGKREDGCTFCHDATK